MRSHTALPSGLPDRPPSGSLRSPWLAVAGMCGIYFAFGLAVGVMAPLVDEISADLDLNLGTMGSILGAWALIYVFTAVPAGALIDRLGLRWSVTLGGFSVATSLLLRAAASGAWSLFGAVAVFGIGGPLISIAAPKLVASLFDEEARRLPTGLAVSAPALGSAVALAVTNPVLLPATDGDWRTVLVITAAAALTMTLLWLYASTAVAHVAQGATRTDRSTLIRLIRLPTMQRILMIALVGFFFSHALNNWLPEILTDGGTLSDNGAGYLAAISVTCGIAGSLMLARLIPARHRAIGLATIFVVLAVTVLSLRSLPVAPLLVMLGIMGFARAGLIPLLFLTIMGDRDIALSDMGAATGLFFAIAEIGGFAGPYVTGFFAEQSNDFGSATVMLAIVCLAGAAASLTLARLPDPPS